MHDEYKLADAFTDASACVCGCVYVVHVYERVRKRTHVCAAMCVRERVCVCSRKRFLPRISAALPVHTNVS